MKAIHAPSTRSPALLFFFIKIKKNRKNEIERPKKKNTIIRGSNGTGAFQVTRKGFTK